MADLHQLGPKGEAYALALLKKRGHRLLQRNFRCPPGEIDLITWDAGTLVFTEVRVRSERDPVGAAASVDAEKQLRVTRAARWYLARRCGRKAPPPCRFDIVWLQARRSEITASGVIENAFGM